MKIISQVVLFSSLMLLIGCQNMMVGATGDIIYSSTVGIEKENNLENFEKGVLGNLMMVEGLLSVKPDDESLLVSLTKGYAGYSFSVLETYFLEGYYADKDNSVLKQKIIQYYSRAFKYGLRFFKSNRITFKDLVKAWRDEKFKELLDKKLGDDIEDLEGVAFSGHSLAALVNYQKDKIGIVTYLPLAKQMFDWSCNKDPNIGNGICDIFYGAYESSRPRGLGGNPEKGKNYFLNMIAKYPNNWLGRVAYMQYYLIPNIDEGGYLEQKNFMEKAVKIHQKELVWSPRELKEKAVFSNERVRLYQAIAVERYKIMKKYEKDLF